MSSTPAPAGIACYWVLPGRLLAGAYPAHVDQPGAAQRLDALLSAGIDCFVDLTQRGELQPYVPLLEQQAVLRGSVAHHRRFGIPDFGLPDRADMLSTLDAIDSALRSGERVYVHCRGGIGRTGMVVGCWLVRHDHTPSNALHLISEWRRSLPGWSESRASPETAEQIEFVMRWTEPTGRPGS